jgi:alcohol dehydrogenase, propanol-preferring
MRAIQLTAWEHPAELCEVPRPVPGPGELLLAVGGAGLCHSDLHIMGYPEGTLPFPLPFTLGHEVAGTVVELGPGTSGVELGERVLVYGPWGCGRCRRCSLGEEHLCERGRELPGRASGIGYDGGLAEFMVVPSPRLTVPIGDLDPAVAAPLADAALTPYHAIRRALGLLRPGAAAVVIGVGGLGHVAVQLLRALSPARVVAVDTRDEALDVATRSGAHEALNAADLTADDVRRAVGPARAARDLRRAAGGRRAELVIDCVGVDQTLELAADVVAPGGHVSIIGVAGGSFPMRHGRVPLETPVVISNWGTRSELADVVALAQAGAIHVEVERIGLTDVPAAYERLHRGGVSGRVVAVPGPAEAT